MTAKRGRYSAGEGTRVLLIETAERLFARRGYDGVTLADIRAAAGQHNASVIGYYFGSKENLLRAIFAHRLPAISADRDALAARSIADGGAPTTRTALWILVQPLANTLRDGNNYVGLLDRLMETEILAHSFRSVDPAMTDSGFGVDRALHTALAELPEELRRQRIGMVYESALHTLARYNRSGTVPGRAELSSLIDAWDGLLHAPASDETRSIRDGIRI
ncbi:TetR/AcrR family transcriptional regulator [Nocardia flavorosea]|uniref:TetR/AcrR family transcriptional regulator n=1 Tax=Nocardia flavorosea TaxID=53429 RepID=A0A846Y8N3_9NOCA|nr:TetR/AcrR family transcriptional regulator [Nocardia flavorosea]NKY54795.1 TetR/AcrR family transcriptional regulator [Nocardia flavorosea]